MLISFSKQKGNLVHLFYVLGYSLAVQLFLVNFCSFLHHYEAISILGVSMILLYSCANQIPIRFRRIKLFIVKCNSNFCHLSKMLSKGKFRAIVYKVLIIQAFLRECKFCKPTYSSLVKNRMYIKTGLLKAS